MTIKDFQKVIFDRYSSPSEQSPVLSTLLERLHNKEFWIWDIDQHKQRFKETNGDCCFNHVCKLPSKPGGPPQPLYPFQKQIYDTLFLKENSFKDFHLWLKKSTGIGATTLFTRILAWLCVKDSKLAASDVIVIVGPRLELATMIINKIKSVFTTADPRISFNTKETTVFLNSVDNDEPARIVSYPSNHTSTARGLVPSIILMDECAYFSKSEASEARILGERYFGKTNPILIMCSTPLAASGMFWDIEREPEETTLYRRLFMPYQVALGTIITQEHIDKAMKSSVSFDREYLGLYTGKIGNIHHPQDLERALAYKYDCDYINPSADRSLSIDAGFGSSDFSICCLQLNNNLIETLYCDSFARPDYTQMIKLCYTLIKKYTPNKVRVDGANPEIIRSILLELGMDPEYEKAIERYKAMKLPQTAIENNLFVLPINFRQDSVRMITHAKLLLEAGLCAINEERFPKLATAIRTAYMVDGKLSKEITQFDDIYDTWRMCLMEYKYE
ncbi:MAG: hypothetical protein M3P08_07675 [Thermoproteota archaeon]|nr:hypothetical protein [Thermoproteota archaeon]